MPWIAASSGSPGLLVSGPYVVPLSSEPSTQNGQTPTVTLAPADYQALLEQARTPRDPLFIVTAGQPVVLVSGSLRVRLPDDAGMNASNILTLSAAAYEAIVQAT